MSLQGDERKVAAFFEAFEHFHLGKESFHHLYEQILAGLEKVMIPILIYLKSQISRLVGKAILSNVTGWLV